MSHLLMPKSQKLWGKLGGQKVIWSRTFKEFKLRTTWFRVVKHSEMFDLILILWSQYQLFFDWIIVTPLLFGVNIFHSKMCCPVEAALNLILKFHVLFGNHFYISGTHQCDGASKEHNICRKYLQKINVQIHTIIIRK